MAALQARLVDHAATMVRPGGLLVYATCSLEPAEGEAQIDRFLGSHSDFAIDPVLPDELHEGIAPHPRGWLRTLPGMLAEQGGCDGFFIARLMRVGIRGGLRGQHRVLQGGVMVGIRISPAIL